MTTTKAQTHKDIIDAAMFTAEEQIEFRAQYPTLKSWEDAYPVAQNFHAGGWGYKRIYDCLDLSQCSYPNEGRARAGRKFEYEHRYGDAKA